MRIIHSIRSRIRPIKGLKRQSCPRRQAISMPQIFPNGNFAVQEMAHCSSARKRVVSKKSSDPADALETELLAADFVPDENATSVPPEVMREIAWGKAGIITIFSPDGTRVFTADRTDDFAQIWDEATRTELKVLRPFKIEWGRDWVSYSEDGREILVTAEDGTVRRYDADIAAPEPENL